MCSSFVFLYVLKNPPFFGRGLSVLIVMIDYRFRRAPALGLTIVLYVVPMASENSVIAFDTFPVQINCQQFLHLEPTETSVWAITLCLRDANNLSRRSRWFDGCSILLLCTMNWFCEANTKIFFKLVPFTHNPTIE